MTEAEIFPAIRQIRYKPNFGIDVIGLYDGTAQVNVWMEVIDIEGIMRGAIKIGQTLILSPEKYTDMTGNDLAAAVFDAIKSIELHEAAEWFTYKGERIFNPHKASEVPIN
jgi:hypothetical protein